MYTAASILAHHIKNDAAFEFYRWADGLSWSLLNEVLLATENLNDLQQLLEAITTSGRMARALRVHGRMNTVRRAIELREIKRRCK